MLKQLTKTFRFTSHFYQGAKFIETKTKSLKLYSENTDPHNIEEQSDAAEFLSSLKKQKKVELGETVTLRASKFMQKVLLSEHELLKLIIVDKQFHYSQQIQTSGSSLARQTVAKGFFEHYSAILTSPDQESLAKAIEMIKEDLVTLKDATSFAEQQIDLVYFCIMIEILFLKTDFDNTIQREVARLLHC